jgi:hypothetical protein
MLDTLVGKYFLGDAVHGVVVEEVGRDSMFLIVRYLDWDRHRELTYVHVRWGWCEDGWRFFDTKDALIAWLNSNDKYDGDAAGAGGGGHTSNAT